MTRRKYIDKGIVVVDDPEHIAWLDKMQHEADEDVREMERAASRPGNEQRVTLDYVLKLARGLSSLEKVQLIQRVAPDIERDLAPDRRHRSRL